MAKVKLDAVQEGMIVGADVKNIDDMLLIPSGCRLTERHIKILRTWGIEEVHLESQGETEAEVDPLRKLPPEVAAKLEADVRRAFWKLDGNSSAQQELLRLTVRRRARQALASGAAVTLTNP